MQSTTEIVRQVISEELGIALDAVSDEKQFFSDFGCDSLDEIEIVIALENQFDIEIPDDEAEKVKTVAQAVALVERLLASEAPS